jgi:hypothetical protein
LTFESDLLFVAMATAQLAPNLKLLSDGYFKFDRKKEVLPVVTARKCQKSSSRLNTRSSPSNAKMWTSSSQPL